MSKNNANFGDKKIKKRLLQKQNVTKINDIDVDKILVSEKELYGTKNLLKFFYGYNDNDVMHMTIMHKASTNDWLCKKS